MASRKSKRYGSHGSKHARTPNPERRNGKAWKVRLCGKRHGASGQFGVGYGEHGCSECLRVAQKGFRQIVGLGDNPFEVLKDVRFK